MSENAKSTDKLTTIGQEIQLFVAHIDSLQKTLPLTMLFIQHVGKDRRKKLEDFEEKNCTVTLENEKRRVSVPMEHGRHWKKLRSHHERLMLARILVPRSLLVSLVSQYDAFLGRLLTAIFRVRPESLNSSDKPFSYSQVASFSSIEAIRDHVIDKEIESVLRSSHTEQIRYMETKFGLPLTTDLSIWPTFIELTERRNLFVHADGIVSYQYLSVCKQVGFSNERETLEGSRLDVAPTYFANSCDCIFELGVKLAHVLWRKVIPAEREQADDNLISITFDLIENEDYELAISLLDFACETLKKYSNEASELMLIINRAQAYKWFGNDTQAQKILSRIDWSAKSDEFKLADAVLRTDWQKAITVMRRIGSAGAIEKLQYRDWPLFKEFRAEPEFLTCYQDVFGEAFPTSLTADTSSIDASQSGVLASG